ncbi:MAG: hypothetical protein PHO41_11940 [Eubacteriales bacterium]|nr:hypothetical protein [Eubacteriales bacterium]
MVNVSEWLKNALIAGMQRGTVSREMVIIKTVDYNANGQLSDAQVEEVAAAIEARDAEIAAAEAAAIAVEEEPLEGEL